MALWPSWSRRKRERSASPLDPFKYDLIPQTLRVQIIHLFNKVENETVRVGGSIVKFTVNHFREEFGVFELDVGFHQTDMAEFTAWFLKEQNIDRILDAIEFVLRIAPQIRSQWNSYDKDLLEMQIAELNARLMEAGVGYQFVEDQIVQMTDEFNHKEVILPALQLISSPKYFVVQKEFLEGHGAFRQNDFEKVIIECHKALESTLKIIAAERNWGTSENANAKKLIDAAFEQNFIPSFMQSGFTSLRSMLDSSVPAIRNKSAAHGQGNAPRTVSASLARFQLNQTAVAIRFLVDLDGET